MKITQLATKTTKNIPADETAKNAKLLLQAGYIHKEMAGVYDLLPLGWKVAENIKQIVREEMNAIGGNEMLMSSLQRKDVWSKTDRWDDKQVDVWFRTQLKNGSELGLGWSHEEPITDMMINHISSYKDLPRYVYQFQNKLRNELRAKSGIMRGREFTMKDLYSYSDSQESHQTFYDSCIEAYHRIFQRLGIGEQTYFTYASGGAFTKYSHEFQTICEAGEDIIYVHEQKKLAINEEALNDEVLGELGVKKEDLVKKKAAEVGNIFSFGGTKSEQLGLYFTDKEGQRQPVILGSYGIGITRLIGVITEMLSDDKGLVWPAQISPYLVYLAEIDQPDQADIICQKLTEAGISYLHDERDIRPGNKFADADLLGFPYRVVISGRSLEAGGVEFKERTSSQAETKTIDEVIDLIKAKS